jgi:hypothetical protein
MAFLGRFSDKTRIKYFENNTFTMWKGSFENFHQQIESYQLFRKRSVEEHCVQDFVHKN